MNKWIVGLLVLTVFASCASRNYQTTRMIKHDFTQYKSYGWMTPVDSLSKAYFSNDISRHNILETANQLLEEKGLTYVKEDPDLLFRYIAIVNNKSRDLYQHSNWGYGPRFYGGYFFNPFYSPFYQMHTGPVGKQRYRAGYLIIEALDRKTNTVVWQARGSQELGSPEKAINNLPKMVKQILGLYPVK